MLSEKGAPTPVAWTRLRAPQSSMAPAPAATLTSAVAGSSFTTKYGTAVDRESAHELLTARAAKAERGAGAGAARSEHDSRAEPARRSRQRAEPSAIEHVVTSAPMRSFLRSAGTVLGREITRSRFGAHRR